METKRKATMVRLSDQDLQAILAIRRHTGIRSDNQAMVYALHFTANALEKGEERKG